MKNPLAPHVMFGRFADVSPDFLRLRGVRLLFSDVDNTLAPYETPDPSDEVKAWVAALKKAGIRLVFISNNHAQRLERFARELDVPFYPDSKKPLPNVFRRVAKEYDVPLMACAVLGDQVFTDVLGARALGMQAFMVPPIKDKTTLFFRAKRYLERPVMRYYAKGHPGHTDLSFWNIKE